MLKASLLIFILSSCTSYVPVKYRQVSTIQVPSGTTTKVTFSPKSLLSEEEQTLIRENFKAVIIEDSWWVYKNPEESANFELVVETFTTSAQHSSSNIKPKEEGSKERVRSSTYSGKAEISYNLVNSATKKVQPFVLTTQDWVSSEVEIPKETNTSAILPVIGLMLGYDRVEAAKNSQDAELKSQVLRTVSTKMAKVSMSEITPTLMTAELEIDDEIDEDSDVIIEFVRKRDFDGAYHYLHALLQQKARSDLLYNLGVIQEARGLHQEGCELYLQANKLKEKKLYSKQRAACLSRVSRLPKK